MNELEIVLLERKNKTDKTIIHDDIIFVLPHNTTYILLTSYISNIYQRATAQLHIVALLS